VPLDVSKEHYRKYTNKMGVVNVQRCKMLKGVKRNITKVIQGIPNEKYRNIIKRQYEKHAKYVRTKQGNDQRITIYKLKLH
jgi:hypothetical protein